MKSLRIISVAAAMLFAGAALAQSRVDVGNTVDTLSTSGAINSGVNVVSNSYQSPFNTTSTLMDYRLRTNQAAQAGTAIATMAVIGTCQTAGRAGGLQFAPVGFTYSGKGDLEPICGGINSGALLGAVYKAKDEAAKPGASANARAYAKVMQANACAVESIADTIETANSVDSNVELCPEVVTRASRAERRERAAAALMGAPRQRVSSVDTGSLNLLP